MLCDYCNDNTFNIHICRLCAGSFCAVCDEHHDCTQSYIAPEKKKPDAAAAAASSSSSAAMVGTEKIKKYCGCCDEEHEEKHACFFLPPLPKATKIKKVKKGKKVPKPPNAELKKPVSSVQTKPTLDHMRIIPAGTLLGCQSSIDCCAVANSECEECTEFACEAHEALHADCVPPKKAPKQPMVEPKKPAVKRKQPAEDDIDDDLEELLDAVADTGNTPVAKKAKAAPSSAASVLSYSTWVRERCTYCVKQRNRKNSDYDSDFECGFCIDGFINRELKSSDDNVKQLRAEAAEKIAAADKIEAEIKAAARKARLTPPFELFHGAVFSADCVEVSGNSNGIFCEPTEEDWEDEVVGEKITSDRWKWCSLTDDGPLYLCKDLGDFSQFTIYRNVKKTSNDPEPIPVDEGPLHID